MHPEDNLESVTDWAINLATQAQNTRRRTNPRSEARRPARVPTPIPVIHQTSEESKSPQHNQGTLAFTHTTIRLKNKGHLPAAKKTNDFAPSQTHSGVTTLKRSTLLSISLQEPLVNYGTSRTIATASTLNRIRAWNYTNHCQTLNESPLTP